MSPPDAAARPAAPDPTLPGLNGEFIAALTALSRAGEADLACRIAARAWTLLRHAAPEEARRLETLLHRLTRPISPTRKEEP